MQARVPLTLGAVVLLVLLGPPIVMGFGIERLHAQVMRQAGGQADADYELVGELDRGLFVSRARTVLRTRGAAEGEDSEIVFEHAIVHGPIPVGELWYGRSPLRLVAAVVDTRYEVDPARMPRIAAALGSRPLLQLLAHLHFDRSADLRLHSPAFTLEGGGLSSDGIEGEAHVDPTGRALHGRVRLGPFVVGAPDGVGGVAELAQSELHFQGVPSEAVGNAPDGSSETPAETSLEESSGKSGEKSARKSGEKSREKGQHVEGELLLGAVRLAGAGGETRIEPSRLTFSTDVVRGDWRSGRAELALGRVQAERTGSASGLRVLEGLRMTQQTSQSEDGALGHVETLVTLDRLVTRNEYGPGRLRLAMRNFDSRAIQGFAAAVDALDTSALSEEEAMAARAALFAEWMPKVLGPSPEIVLEELHLASSDGSLEGDARLSIDGSEPELLTNPLMVMAMLEAYARVAIPVAMMNELLDGYLVSMVAADAGEMPEEQLYEMAGFMRDALLAKLVTDGMLVDDGGRFRVDLRLREGLPMLNGRPVDASRLSGIVPGM